MTNTLSSISSTISRSLSDPIKATKAKLPHSNRTLTVVENKDPNLVKSSSVESLQREATEGFEGIVSEDHSPRPTDEELVEIFKFNEEEELRKTLNSLCDKETPVLEFLQAEGKSKKQQVDEYKQLKNDINNGIKLNSEISGLPGIETLNSQKKIITQAAIAAGLDNPKLDIVKNFFSNKDNILALGVALSGLAVSLPTLITGIVASENAVDGEVEKTDKMVETQQEIANAEQEIKELERKLNSEDQQKEIMELKRSFAETTLEKELLEDKENTITDLEGGNIIGKELNKESKEKVAEAGKKAVEKYQSEQKSIQIKINEAESRIDALQNKLATQTTAAPRQTTNSINSGAVIGIGAAMMAGSLIAGGAIKYHSLKRNSQGKPSVDLSEDDKNKIEVKKQQALEKLEKAAAEKKRLKQEAKENTERLQREERSKNAQAIFSISHQEYQASKSIPEDSDITKVSNSSKDNISDQSMSDKSTSKETDVTKN